MPAMPRGLILPDLPDDYVSALRDLGLAEWGSFANPLDLASMTVEHFRTAARMADEADLADIIMLMFGDPIVGAADLAAELAADIAGVRLRRLLRWRRGRAGRAAPHAARRRAGVPVA